MRLTMHSHLQGRLIYRGFSFVCWIAGLRLLVPPVQNSGSVCRFPHACRKGNSCGTTEQQSRGSTTMDLDFHSAVPIARSIRAGNVRRQGTLPADKPAGASKLHRKRRWKRQSKLCLLENSFSIPRVERVGSCVSLGRHSCPKSVWLGALCPDRAPGRLPLQGVWGRGACKIFLKPRRWPIGSMHATSEEVHAEKPAMQHHHAACLSRQLCSDSTECECEKKEGR